MRRFRTLFRKFICQWKGHNFNIDTKVYIGTCRRCGRTYKVERQRDPGGPDYGGFFSLEEINCGDYWCSVQDPYGFVAEGGCPKHD